MDFERELHILDLIETARVTCLFNGKELPLNVVTLNRGIMADVEDSTVVVGFTDGVNLVKSRYKEKSITMSYNIIIDNADFGELRDNLASLLDTNGELQQLIFSDQPDRYYLAKVTGATPLEEGYKVGTGEITWLVPDGLAHALTEKEFIAVPDASGHSTLTIVNGGNVPVAVEYEIVHRSTNNFIQISSKDDKAMLKFGEYRDVTSGASVGNELLVNTSSLITLPTGISVPTNSKLIALGTLAERDINGVKAMYLSSVPANGSSTSWVGGLKEYVVPDSGVDGSIGAKSFVAYFNATFETGLLGQTGCLNLEFLDDNDELLFRYLVEKTDGVGNTAYCKMMVGGNNPRVYKTFEFQPTVYQEHNPFDFARGHCEVKKVGETLSGYWWGTHFSIIVPELKNKVCKKVQFYIGQYANYGLGDDYVTNIFLKSFNFTRTSALTFGFLPKSYAVGDRLTYSGKTGMLYKNRSVPVLGDKVRGSKDFKVEPGSVGLDINYNKYPFTPEQVIDPKWIVDPYLGKDGKPVYDSITGERLVGRMIPDPLNMEEPMLDPVTGLPTVIQVTHQGLEPFIKAKIREAYL